MIKFAERTDVAERDVYVLVSRLAAVNGNYRGSKT